MAILAACGSGTETTASSTTSTAAPASEPATTEAAAEAAEAEAPAEESAPAEETEAAAPGLQMQWVELGFVSAYVLVRGSEAAIVDTCLLYTSPSPRDRG